MQAERDTDTVRWSEMSTEFLATWAEFPSRHERGTTPVRARARVIALVGHTRADTKTTDA